MNSNNQNQKIRDYFARAKTADNLSHAYCLVGPVEADKRAVVDFLASEYLGVPVPKLFLHPDYHYLAPAVNEKTGKTKRDITVEQATELVQKLTAGGIEHRFVVIDEADSLNSFSANALLKTIEEPRGQTHLFFIVTDDEALPATIRSRCQMIYFSVHPETIIDSELVKTEEARFSALLQSSWCDMINLIEAEFGDKTDPVIARQHLVDLLAVWQILARQAWRTTKTISAARFEKIFTAGERAKQLLAENAHPKWTMEEFLLNIKSTDF